MLWFYIRRNLLCYTVSVGNKYWKRVAKGQEEWIENLSGETC